MDVCFATYYNIKQCLLQIHASVQDITVTTQFCPPVAFKIPSLLILSQCLQLCLGKNLPQFLVRGMLHGQEGTEAADERHARLRPDARDLIERGEDGALLGPSLAVRIGKAVRL